LNSEDQILDELINDLEHDRLTLPTLPEVALKIRDEIESDNVNAVRVASIVTKDAALSVKLLQIANSPLYRARNPIENIQSAIARLGFTQIRNLISSLVMKQMFQATNDALDLRLRDSWNHSVQVAAISSVLAGQQKGLQKDQAMLAGLVHDIGKLPILVYAENVPELCDDEAALDRILAKLHPIIGEKILNKWDFPSFIVDCAVNHENVRYSHEGPANYVDVLIVSNLQCYIGTNHPLTSQDWSCIPAFEKLGIATDVNVVEIEENQEQIQEIEHILITA